MPNIHISTKVFFEITITKRHVYIDIRWPWIWKHYFYLGIWNDDRSKVIVLPSFQLATRLNSQNTNETEFINELWHINLYMNFGISIWRNWSYDPRKMKWFFFIYFSFFHVYWPPSTWNSLVHTSWGKMELCKNVLFSSSKCEKKNPLKHFLFTRNRVFKHKEFVSNLQVCSYGLWKMWASYIFHLSTRILTSTH